MTQSKGGKMTSKVKWYHRSLSDYTPEMREQAIANLEDESLIFLDFMDGLVLLNMRQATAYRKANAGDLPGIERSLIGDPSKKRWRFRRKPLKKYLYGEE
jgi:hypothetical protein